jgi:hypothetical protein
VHFPSASSLSTIASQLAILALAILATPSPAVEGVPYNRAYPAEATLVPLAERGRIQQYLDQHGVIRLEAGDYQKGNPGPIRLRSGQRI